MLASPSGRRAGTPVIDLAPLIDSATGGAARLLRARVRRRALGARCRMRSVLIDTSSRRRAPIGGLSARPRPTRSLPRSRPAPTDGWRDGALQRADTGSGRPASRPEAAIASMGAVDAGSARRGLQASGPQSAGPRPACDDLARAAPPRTEARRRGRWRGPEPKPSHAEAALLGLSRGRRAGVGRGRRPGPLSWLGGVLGQRVARRGRQLRPDRKPRRIPHAAQRLDGNAITEAAAEILLQNG